MARHRHKGASEIRLASWVTFSIITATLVVVLATVLVGARRQSPARWEPRTPTSSTGQPR